MKALNKNKKTFHKEIANQAKKDKIINLKTQKHIKEQEQIGKRIEKINKNKKTIAITNYHENRKRKNSAISTSKSNKNSRVNQTGEVSSQINTLIKNAEELEKALERMDIFYGMPNQNEQILNQFEYNVQKNIELYEIENDLSIKLDQNKEICSKLEEELKVNFFFIQAVQRKSIY